jgi:RimJ/RimL family protein N-acetyltransferase
VLTTPRLVLRRPTDEDLAPFAAMNADPDVMRHFPAPLTFEESRALFERLGADYDRDGFGWLTVESRTTGGFVGCVGIRRTQFQAAFTPCIEIAWRLVRAEWGRGLAPEAAHAVLRWAFETHLVEEVFSFTYEGNCASRRVMEKLGMKRRSEFDFEHPVLIPGHRLRPHVVYSMARTTFAGEVTDGV